MAARDLRTVLFTDLVGSTEAATRLGDRAWGELLARHHAVVRAALRANGGHEVDTAGDGFFVTFGRPTAALACAREIVAGVAPLGLAVRVGVHAGEVETREGKAEGLTVHVAARLMAVAGSDEVLVSATVRELVGGAGWTFADRGQLPLKGLVEPVHAYALDLQASAPSITSTRPGLGATWQGITRAQALGAGVLVVSLVAVLVAVSLGGGAAGATATPTALTGAAATPTPGAAAPSVSAASAPGVIADSGGYWSDDRLAPGRYTAMALPGDPQLTVGEGWSVFASFRDDLALGRTGRPNDQFTIMWPASLAADVCNLKSPVPIRNNPEAQFQTWARANKGLQLSSGLLRQFGTLTATEFDVSVVGAYACPYTDPISVAGPLMAAVYNSGAGNGNTAFSAGERLRLEVSSRDNKLILILIEASPPADFDSFDPLVEGVLSTLTFPPAGTTPAP